MTQPYEHQNYMAGTVLLSTTFTFPGSDQYIFCQRKKSAKTTGIFLQENVIFYTTNSIILQQYS